MGAGLAFAVPAVPAVAQTARDTGAVAGVIAGVVRDAESAPLPNVRVLLEGTGRTARTDQRGRFRLEGIAPGTYRISLRQVGYRPTARSVTVETATVDVLVDMEALPQALETLTVTRRALLAEVHAREDAGLGAVLYAEDIPRYRQSNVSDLLRFAPALAAQLAGVKSCTGRVAYLVDGRPLPRGWEIDGYVRLEEIEAIEAHSSADFLKESRLVQQYVPPADRPSRGFGTLRFGAPGSPMGLLTGTCTRVVMVWTKHYRPGGH